MAKRNEEVVGWGEVVPADMTFDQLMEAGVIDIAEIDDQQLVDKATLVGTPFILFDWEIKPSEEFGGDFAICRVKTPEGTAIFTDGGAGIVDALERYQPKLSAAREAGQNMALYFHYGLRASDYVKKLTDPTTGEVRSIPATTYYFDNRRRP